MSARKPRKPADKAKSPSRKSKSGAAPRRAKGSAAIEEKIRSRADWRDDTLAEVRRLIREAVPDIEEERKWVKPGNPMGVPVWSRMGIVCTGETYKEVVKLTFARGASLDDPQGLFNSSLEGSTRRAIDIREGELPDARAFKELIQVAVAENLRITESRASKQRK